MIPAKHAFPTTPPPRAQAEAVEGHTHPRRNPSPIRQTFFVSRSSRPKSSLSEVSGCSSGLLNAGLPPTLFQKPSEPGSGSPVGGSIIVSRELFCGLLSVTQEERRRTRRGGLQRACRKGEHQTQDVISILG